MKCVWYIFLIENNYISSYSRHFGERQVLIEFNQRTYFVTKANSLIWVEPGSVDHVEKCREFGPYCHSEVNNSSRNFLPVY